MSSIEFIASGLSFRPYEFGWTTELNDSFPTFFGHRLRIEIETTPLRVESNNLPKPNSRQIALLTLLVARLDDAIFACSVAFRKGCDDINILHDLAQPQVWIPPDESFESDDDWSLVVERASDLEDGYHIDCEGVEVVNMFHYDDLRAG